VGCEAAATATSNRFDVKENEHLFQNKKERF